MKKRLIVILALALAFALATGCTSKKDQKRPQNPAQAEDSLSSPSAPGPFTVTALVQAVNLRNRVITLKHPDGRTIKAHCGPGVLNFGQIEPTDEITAEFQEAAGLNGVGHASAFDDEEPPRPRRARRGEAPMAPAVHGIEVAGTVETVDANAKGLTMKGPAGETLIVRAAPDSRWRAGIKPGDRVVARFTEISSAKIRPTTQTRKQVR
jgi:hypothetical protein